MEYKMKNNNLKTVLVPHILPLYFDDVVFL